MLTRQRRKRHRQIYCRDPQQNLLGAGLEVQYRHATGLFLESSKKEPFRPSVSALHTGFTEWPCGTSCQLGGVSIPPTRLLNWTRENSRMCRRAAEERTEKEPFMAAFTVQP